MATIPWIQEMLRACRASFEERHHPETITAFQAAEQEHLPPAEMAKVVVIVAREKPIALTLPANRRVDMKAVESHLKTTKLRLATEEEMQRFFPDCELGAIPPLRHWAEIELWADPSLETPNGELCFQAGTHQDAIRMRYDDWYRIVRPRVERFAAAPRRWVHPSAVDEEEERWRDEPGALVG